MQIFRDAVFDPEALTSLCAAYELAAQMAHGRDGADAAIDEAIAKSVIRVAEAGERDPETIALSALLALGLRGDD